MHGRQQVSGRAAAILPALLAAMLVLAPGIARAQGGQADLGRDLAQKLCATCHAIGAAERSPNAMAPAFRRIDQRIDLDEMAEKLREGIIGGHPEMPVFKLTPPEARALTAYLRSIQSDRKN